MRSIFLLIFFFCLTLYSSALMAQSEDEELSLVPEKPKNFYETCLSGPAIYDQQTLEFSCACLAAHMESTKQMIRNSRDRGSGIFSTDKSADIQIPPRIMITDVYGPCLFIEGKQYAESQCLADHQIQAYIPNNDERGSICECVGNLIESYLEDTAQAHLSLILQNGDIQIDDPLQYLTRRQDYRAEYTKSRQFCVYQTLQSSP